MSETLVESRRFRTWDESRELEAKHRWRLLIKMQFLRYKSSWYFWLLVAAGVVFSVASLIMPFEVATWGYLQGEAVAAFYFVPAGIAIAAVTLLIAAPAISEDLRFNAPLFYFSRPLRVIDYFVAKAAFLAIVMLGLLLVPLIFLGIGTMANLDFGEPEYPSYFDHLQPEDRAEAIADHRAYWEVNAMNSVGDWIFVNWTLWAGTISTIAFVVALALLVNTFTTRAWHAGVAFIVVFGAWSLIGMGAGTLMSDTSSGMLLSPAGWIFAVTELGIWDYFTDNEWDNEFLADAPMTVAFSHLLLWGTAAAMTFWAYRRLRNMEGAL